MFAKNLMSHFLVRPETSADYPAIRTVHRQAFGQDAEGELVDALREAGDLLLSLVAVEDDSDAIVGHIAFSRVKIVAEGKQVAGVSLAPMAVLPDRQRQGTRRVTAMCRRWRACRHRPRPFRVLSAVWFLSALGGIITAAV